MKLSSNIVGILITVSIHLAVIIVLLLAVVEPRLEQQRQSIEIDFTEQDKIEKLEKELAKRKALNEKLDRMLREAGVNPSSNRSEVRNVSVDASLKDDRGTDAEKLYKEAARIQKEYEQNMSRDNSEDYAELSQKAHESMREKQQENTYKGPATVTYQLEGRKASIIKTPAYKCMYAGEVTVIINVDSHGKVLSAKVQDEVSSSDTCLRQFAVQAALNTRFSKSPTSQPRQIGSITYTFLEQ